MAERLEIDRSTVVRWESGDSEPQPWLRPKIARALQVSMEQLAELLAENAPGSEITTSEPAWGRHVPNLPGGVLLPIMVDGRPVLVPLDARTVATSGLGMYLNDQPAEAGSSPRLAVTATEWTR